ncbi:MAG TPA: thioredoxin [Pseudonocardiaceae bacterium]|jgi:thioredoxin 1
MSITTRQELAAVTDASFAQEVLASAQPVLVEFWATWCGPCRMLAPVLAELAAEHADQLRVVKLDIDVNPVTVRDLRILGAPTMILFRDGQAVASVVGARSKSAVWQAFERYL